MRRMMPTLLLVACAAAIGAEQKPREFQMFSPDRSVFVCCAAESMKADLQLFEAEITKAVGGRKAGQKFNVIFYQDGQATAFEKDDLVEANDENKEKLPAFFQGVTAHGTRDPTAAIALALRQKPSVVYLMTDGRFHDNAAVLNQLRVLNQRDGHTPVPINPILLARDESVAKEMGKVMMAIAEANGGVYRCVMPDDLKKPPAAK